jgi:hypothetical protein
VINVVRLDINKSLDELGIRDGDTLVLVSRVDGELFPGRICLISKRQVTALHYQCQCAASSIAGWWHRWVRVGWRTGHAFEVIAAQVAEDFAGKPTFDAA